MAEEHHEANMKSKKAIKKEQVSSNDEDTSDDEKNVGDDDSDSEKNAGEYVPMTFPQRMMEILSNEELSGIATWLPHGRGFVIVNKKRFANEVMPKYFNKISKFTSFTRKLNRWNFTRVTRGPETGAYYHPLFQRDKLRLCMQMCCDVPRSSQQSVSLVGGFPMGPAIPTGSRGALGSMETMGAMNNEVGATDTAFSVGGTSAAGAIGAMGALSATGATGAIGGTGAIGAIGAIGATSAAAALGTEDPIGSIQHGDLNAIKLHLIEEQRQKMWKERQNQLLQERQLLALAGVGAGGGLAASIAGAGAVTSQLNNDILLGLLNRNSAVAGLSTAAPNEAYLARLLAQDQQISRELDASTLAAITMQQRMNNLPTQQQQLDLLLQHGLPQQQQQQQQLQHQHQQQKQEQQRQQQQQQQLFELSQKIKRGL